MCTSWNCLWQDPLGISEHFFPFFSEMLSWDLLHISLITESGKQIHQPVLLPHVFFTFHWALATPMWLILSTEISLLLHRLTQLAPLLNFWGCETVANLDLWQTALTFDWLILEWCLAFIMMFAYQQCKYSISFKNQECLLFQIEHFWCYQPYQEIFIQVFRRVSCTVHLLWAVFWICSLINWVLEWKGSENLFKLMIQDNSIVGSFLYICFWKFLYSHKYLSLDFYFYSCFYSS